MRLDKIRLSHVLAGGSALLALLLGVGWATRTPPGETPYLRIAGAGFMFNYRVADAYYGFTAQLMKPVANASVIEASFENPAGGAPLVVSERLWPSSGQYGIRSPSLFGIRKDRPYEVRVRLLEGVERKPVFEKRFTVKSDLDDDVMPTKPLVVGPGYRVNPDNPAGR